MGSVYDDKPWLETYPDWMPEQLAIPDRSVLDEFIKAVEESPAKPAMCYFDTLFTYGEMFRLAGALAVALKKIGVKRGDRVLCDMQNIPQAVVAALATWMRGAIVVPVNPMYTARELDYYITDSGARVVVCQDDVFTSMVKGAVEGKEGITVITTSALDLLDLDAGPIPAQLANCSRQSSPETLDMLELINANRDAEVEVVYPRPEDLAYLVYTSGTTGPPKGAQITHRNIVHNSLVYESAARLDAGDVVLGVAPLFHITGIVAHLAISFHMQIPMVLFCRFDPEDVLRLIEKYRVTFTVAAITVYIALLNSPVRKNYDVSSFRKAYSGGAPVSPATVNKFKDEMHLTIYNVYGLTESSSPATIVPLGMDGPVDADSGAYSVGLIVPGHEAWIVDVEDSSREMKLGEEGELVLRGPGITGGYWEKEEETAKAIQDGRFFTGDIAKMDEQGWCYIVDRKKDLINASGFKVWPREVEDMLYKHPAVKEAAVVGIPDPYRGETVKAFVSLRDEFAGKTTETELVAFCKGKMAAYKYPRIIEIIGEIPKTATGKILRRSLRDG